MARHIQIAATSNRRRGGAAAAAGPAPEYSSGEIGVVDSKTVEITFTEEVTTTTTFAAGVTILVGSVSYSIAYTNQDGENNTVQYVLTSGVDGTEDITWAYSESSGGINTDGSALADVSAQAVTNTAFKPGDLSGTVHWWHARPSLDNGPTEADDVEVETWTENAGLVAFNQSTVSYEPIMKKGGDAGTATGGTETTLVDSGKSWTADEWIDTTLKITDATDSAVYYVIVTDNDATSLTFVTPGITIAVLDTYTVSHGINGQNALLFDGTDDSYYSTIELGDVIDTGTKTQWLVIEVFAYGPDSVWYGADGILTENSGAWGTVIDEANVKQGNAGGHEQVEVAISLNTTYVVQVRHDYPTMYISVNGGTDAQVTSGYTGGLTATLIVGSNYNRSVFFDGKLAEIIISDDVESLANRNAMQAVLENIYGV